MTSSNRRQLKSLSSLVYLCETRQSEEWVKNLRFRLRMKQCFQVKGDGKGGPIQKVQMEPELHIARYFQNVEINILIFQKIPKKSQV